MCTFHTVLIYDGFEQISVILTFEALFSAHKICVVDHTAHKLCADCAFNGVKEAVTNWIFNFLSYTQGSNNKAIVIYSQ